MQKLLKRLQGHVWKITHLTPVLDHCVRWKAETLLYLAQPALLHMQMKSSFLLMIASFRLLVEDCLLLRPLWYTRPSAALLYVLCPFPPLQGTCSSPLSVEELLLASLKSLWASCYFGKVKTETLLHLAQPVLLQCRWSAASSQTRQFCFDHLRPAQLVRRNELHPSKPLILSWWWRKASGHTLKDYGARNMFNNSESKLRIG